MHLGKLYCPDCAIFIHLVAILFNRMSSGKYSDNLFLISVNSPRLSTNTFPLVTAARAVSGMSLQSYRFEGYVSIPKNL